MSYIEIRHVSKSFGDKTVLQDINLEIEKGEFATFLGASGCGKTTLLRCLIGLESVNHGSICLDGEDITYIPVKQRGMSMIFQQYCLFPNMTVYRNVAFGLKMQSVRRDEIDSRVKEALYMVGLSGHEGKYTYQLSGGEQQRVSLARSLVVRPKVLLLDEPFSAIDAKLRKELQLYLKGIHKELGMTSVFVTHDQEEAMRMSDSIHLFHDGMLEQSAAPEMIYAAPKTPYVAGFIGSYNILPTQVFAQMAGSGFGPGQVAFRPEIISISHVQPPPDEAHFQISGTIQDHILQGNVVRYTVSVTGGRLHVDEIFDTELSYRTGDHVYLEIAKSNVLYYPD